MKNLLFVLFDVTLQANCTRKKCNYNQDINTISVRIGTRDIVRARVKFAYIRKTEGLIIL